MFPKLNTIVRELWLWCMNRDITLVAKHLPGVLNTIADQESWVMRDRSDWMLNPRIFKKIQQKWGPLEVDMFASRLTTQLKRFFSWRPDPEAEALNAFNQNWSNLQERGLCQPPLESSRQGAEQSTTATSHTGPSGSSMEEPAVVSHPTGDAGGLPNPPPTQGGSDHTNTPRGCTSSTASTSRMAYLRQRFQDKEILEEGTELLLVSWRQKSSKSYDSLFRKWVDWCNQRHSDPVSGSISEVVNFLAHMFKEGYQYRAYERRTESFRSGENEEQTRLFLAVVRPHKPVCWSTLARWLKSLLDKAGIDTSIFKAHSTRSTAVSVAANTGITTSDILKAVDWSSETVFTKFYYKPLRSGTFGEAVLSKSGN